MKKRAMRLLNSLNNIRRAVRYFVTYWFDYPRFKYWMEHMLRDEIRNEILEAEAEAGEDTSYRRNRLAYATHLTKIWWDHRDRYSLICEGDCERCEAKHC